MNLADSSGNVTGAYTYDVFGAVRSHTGASTEFSFTGEQNDPNGFEYLRARYYDPAVGRFTARDPAGAGYGYASGNPVNRVDPAGLSDCTFYNYVVQDWLPCDWENSLTALGIAPATAPLAVGYALVGAEGLGGLPGFNLLFQDDLFKIRVYVLFFRDSNPLVLVDTKTPPLCVVEVGCTISWVHDRNIMLSLSQNAVLVDIQLHSDLLPLSVDIVVGFVYVPELGVCQAIGPHISFSNPIGYAVITSTISGCAVR